MAKKQRSAKQKAATRKLVAFNKRKRSTPKRKTPKRKAAKRKVNKVKRKSKSVTKKGPIKAVIENPTLKKVLMAAGAVTIATSVAAIVAPQFVPTLQRPIVKAVLGFVTGDFVGAASNFVLGGGAGNVFNVNGGSQNALTSGGNGFA